MLINNQMFIDGFVHRVIGMRAFRRGKVWSLDSVFCYLLGYSVVSSRDPDIFREEADHSQVKSL